MANEPTLTWCSSLCPVLCCFFSSLRFQKLPGGATAHCLDPVYLGLISDPTLSPCTPVLEKLFYGQETGLSSHSSSADVFIAPPRQALDCEPKVRSTISE